MVAPADPVQTLPVTAIHPSAHNPRRSYNAAADAELLESIRTHGILTPLLVRPIDDWHGSDLYEVVAGHRRLAAAQELGLEAVPVTIRTLTDDQARETAIVENLQREDLAPLDEAESYQALLAIPGATPSSVAAAVGKSPAYVGRRLKLLGLVEDAQAALREGRMDVARAELLTKLTPALQVVALRDVVWMPLYQRTDGGIYETLESLSYLREWVEKRTRLTFEALSDDTETQALFPEAAEAVLRDLAEPTTELHEVALDRFGQSPAKVDIPAGVLRLNKDFREVTGNRCKAAERAIVVFGQRKGDVVDVCCDKKGCTTHWPPKEQAAPAERGRPQMTWQEEQAAREREHRIFERIVPDLRKAVVLATARIKTTPATLAAMLDERHPPADIKAAVAACGGKLTIDNFARVVAVLDGFRDLCNVRGAEHAIKASKLAFDLKKAMKAAEVAMVAEETPGKAALKKVIAAETKKPAGTPAKKRKVAMSGRKQPTPCPAGATKPAPPPAPPKKARAA